MELKMKNTLTWKKVANIDDIPENGSACVVIEGYQIAIFNLNNKKDWYATQNLCPHRNQYVLSRGFIGDKNGEPMISCPLHKNSYSLKDGKVLSDKDYSIQLFNIKEENGDLFIEIDEDKLNSLVEKSQCQTG